MHKLAMALTTAAAMLMSFATPASATVTFDFYETGVVSCAADTCTEGSLPALLLRMTLSDPTESGSAFYGGPGFGAPPPPQVSDPNFGLVVLTGATALEGGLRIEAPNFGVFPDTCCLSYNISWDEVGRQLDSISFSLSTDLDALRGIGLTGGTIGSDGLIGTCVDGSCVITGAWVRVPEPGSATMLLSALFGFGLVRRRRGTRSSRSGARSS